MRAARELTTALGAHYAEALAATASPAPGLRELLELAASYSMPCAAISQVGPLWAG